MLEHRVEHQLLIALIDNISELVVFFNSDGEIILFNQRAKKFFNIDTSQITNLRLSDLASTLKIDQLTTEPINSLKEKLPIEQIETTYTANNTANYIIWSIYDLKQQRNERDIFILLGKDVTDLKNLSSNMEKLDNIIKYAPEMIYWKNTNSIYLGCNDQFAFAANLQDRNDIIGKSDYELPWHIQAKKFCSDDKEVIVTGNPKLNIEDLLQLKDGKQGVVITNKVPLRDLNGAIIGVLGIATDITERKKSETALQQSKSTQEELERLNNIIRYAPDFIYWKDKNSIHLGCNDRFAHTVGYKNREDIIGKSDFDFPWKAQAEKYKLDDEDVIKTGTPKLNIPDIVITADGQELQVISNKVPLCDSTGAVIGVLGITTDITHQKQTEHDLKDAKEAAESALQSMKQAQIEEQKHREEAELLAIENAKQKAELEAQNEFNRLVSQVYHDINTPLLSFTSLLGLLSQLPHITTIDGYKIALISEPTRNKHTVYLEQTDTGLKYEVLGEKNTLNQGVFSWETILTELKDHFPKNNTDLNLFQKECLPALLNLIIKEKHATQAQPEPRVPENLRIVFRNLLKKSRKIVNTLKKRGKNKDENNPDEVQQNILFSAFLIQSLDEKSIEYKEKSIEFNHEFEKQALFTFVEIQVSQVGRALSNLINNAVDAFEDNPGVVTLKLSTDNEYVQIIIQDNGKGMAQEAIDRIMNKIAFTEGKKNGHGIGLGQVRDTLEKNDGTMRIESALGEGTKVILAFPKQPPPAWGIDTLQITSQDVIVIVDDDDSIHWTWDNVFAHILNENPGIRILHFQQGQEAIDEIQKLSEQDKNNLLLLSDFELLNQELNGLDVIKAAKAARAVLVSSHYDESDIQKEIITLGAKLLPKQLATEIPICVTQPKTHHSEENIKVVNAIWVDDDPMVTDLQCQLLLPHVVDVYRTPYELMKSIEPMCIYSKNTAVFLDYNFDNADEITGIDIAKKLHELGFIKLYLLSGQDFEGTDVEIPEYLTVLPKSAAAQLNKYF